MAGTRGWCVKGGFAPRRLGCVGGLVACVVVAAVVFFAPTALFAPWGFFIGGQFHLIPMWEGWGRIHSPSEGDYLLFVQLASPRLASRNEPTVSGWAEIRAPRGEMTRLRLAGYLERGTWSGTDGRTMRLHMYRYNASPINDAGNARRPRLDFRGVWHNPVFDADDEGSVSRAFTAAGTVNMGHLPSTRWTSRTTLRPGSYADFAAACRAAGAARAAR